MKNQPHTLRKALVYLMLSVYVFGLVKPVMPLVQDALAHTFFKSKHMATVHFENGRYHLHLELKTEAQKENSKPQAVASFEALAIHVKTEAFQFIPYLTNTAEIHSPYHNDPTDVILSTPLLPPEC